MRSRKRLNPDLHTSILPLRGGTSFVNAKQHWRAYANGNDQAVVVELAVVEPVCGTAVTVDMAIRYVERSINPFLQEMITSSKTNTMPLACDFVCGSRGGIDMRRTPRSPKE